MIYLGITLYRNINDTKMKKLDRQKSFAGLDLTGKTIVFTGGTDGMGKAAVEKLAAMGATIMLLGRSKDKTIGVVSELNKIANAENTHYVPCDLGSLESVRNAAKNILEKCQRIDLLINCAGAQTGARRIVNNDGYETNWAINHLGPFLLTYLLLDVLKESSPSRIVNLSSATERSGHIHFEDLQLAENWSVFKAYPQAKLAMNMCTRKMAKELEGSGVNVNALNPGFIKSNLLRDLKGWTAIVGIPYMFFFASKPEVGADRILRVALSKEFDNVSGQFVYEDVIRDPNPEALDDELVERVWDISLQQIGLKTQN